VNRDYFEEMAGTRRGELTVLLQTPEVPRNIVCHRAELAPAVVVAVTRTLIGMDDDEEGRKVLAGFEGTLRFDRFAEGPETALAPIYNLLQYVEEDLGESGAAD
jgi:ABC-type phosphate/phosphonate transport system substrate-binding protein